MSSSDDEDCYGNVAKKLQSLKNNYRPGKLVTTVDSVKSDTKVNIEQPTFSKDDSIINLLEDVPEIPDPPISVPATQQASRPSGRTTRSQGPPRDPQPANQPAALRRGRKRKSDPAETRNACGDTSFNDQTETINDAVADTARRKSTAGRGRARGARRGRGTRRNLRREIISAFANTIIYSIGNTLEYPDTAEGVPIFNKIAQTGQTDAVESIDLSSSFAEEDENEELSVKVCWQQTEYVKFNIRKFQKLTQLFDFFSKRESVSADKILLTLKGKILRPDDTPDSIQYNIAQFIDGGVVNSSISVLAPNNKENASTSGILVKFQCQNSKKPFEIYIEADQKLSTAMIKCAEHFELPFAKLRFVFDGDAVSAASSPRDHGLDHGDCIDVKVAA